MFCGNDEAAEMATIAYSLLGCCRLANVNPQEWLTDVLNQIQGHSIEKLTGLLPTHWHNTLSNNNPESVEKSRGSFLFYG